MGEEWCANEQKHERENAFLYQYHCIFAGLPCQSHYGNANKKFLVSVTVIRRRSFVYFIPFS